MPCFKENCGLFILYLITVMVLRNFENAFHAVLFQNCSCLLGVVKRRARTGGPADADWRTRTGGRGPADWRKFFYQFFNYWK